MPIRLLSPNVCVLVTATWFIRGGKRSPKRCGALLHIGYNGVQRPVLQHEVQ